MRDRQQVAIARCINFRAKIEGDHNDLRNKTVFYSHAKYYYVCEGKTPCRAIMKLMPRYGFILLKGCCPPTLSVTSGPFESSSMLLTSTCAILSSASLLYLGLPAGAAARNVLSVEVVVAVPPNSMVILASIG